MAHGPEARAAVRAAFVHQAQPLPEAARLGGVPEATARAWKRRAKKLGDDWDRARAASYIGGQGGDTVLMAMLEHLVTLIESTLRTLREDPDVGTMDRVEAISRLTDAYHKTSAAMARNSPKLSKLAVAMDILERLADFVRTHHPEHAAALLAVLEPFGAEVARAYA